MQLVTDFEGHDIHPHMDGHSMDIESKRGRYNFCLIGIVPWKIINNSKRENSRHNVLFH